MSEPGQTDSDFPPEYPANAFQPFNWFGGRQLTQQETFVDHMRSLAGGMAVLLALVEIDEIREGCEPGPMLTAYQRGALHRLAVVLAEQMSDLACSESDRICHHKEAGQVTTGAGRAAA